MSLSGDYEGEMPQRSDLDDTTAEAVLAHRQVANEDQLVSFVEDVRFATAKGRPEASPALAALFAEGVSSKARDLPAGAASTVSGLLHATQSQQRKKHNVAQTARSKLVSIGVAAKAGFAIGAFALAGTAAAATGSLPDVVQDRVAAAADRVGISIPAGSAADHRQDADHRKDADRRPENTPPAERQQTPANEFGTWVSDQATSGVPQEDGRLFGEAVSTRARELHQPADTPSAEDNPAVEHRPSDTTDRGRQPAASASEQENPGTEERESAPGAKPTDVPTPEDNPGTERRE